MHKRLKSNETYERLCKVIPGGVNSPVRAFKGLEMPTPIIAESGTMARLYDIDGNSYIDYCCSWGALIHGHAHPLILQAARRRLAMGTTFGLTTAIEERLASKICQAMPSIQKIRFVSTGTEATMSALRLARGFTGRQRIVKFSGNYHGHSDGLLVRAGSGLLGHTPTSSSAGVPDSLVSQTICLPFNDVEAVRRCFADPELAGQIAAVLVEPVAGNMGVVPGTAEFLKALRQETTRHGALLIFDEVMTGFRVAYGGAQSLYGIVPDLTCLAKIIGGGFPAAAFGGRAEIMDLLAPLGPVYQAGTLSGNPVAMEAGLQALLMLEKEGVYAELERKTRLITDPIEEAIKKKSANACLQRCGSMFTLFFGKKSVNTMEDAEELDLKRFTDFFKVMLAQGILPPPSQYEAWFVSTVHDEKDLQKTAEAIADYIQKNL